ncbi:MAG: hypothetical protein NTX50_00640 [Candidatus Sumerlaeota bacterium]|nr:hypothetical protein [Candidatus Sumerlaeota bacterium]
MSETLTSRERVRRILNRQIPDHVAFCESFWQDTIASWVPQGYPEGEPPWKFFQHDIVSAWGSGSDAIPGSGETLQETDEWIIARNANGATMKNWKRRPGVPEHIGFEIVNGDVWRKKYREAVRAFDLRRITLQGMEDTLKTARENDLFCCFGGVEVFEIGKDYSGHQHLCTGMLTEPDWIHDMFESFVTMHIQNWTYIFDKIGLPDGFWLYGDIGFRGAPFIGLDMYREMVLPHNKRLIDFLKSKSLPIIFHSCGFIEPLVPGFIESGIDVLQAMEEGGGFIFHTDHSVPKSVKLETYQFALQCALKYGQY